MCSMLTEVYILYFIVQFSIKKKYVNKSVDIEPMKNAIKNRRGKFKDRYVHFFWFENFETKRKTLEKAIVPVASCVHR